MASRLKRLQDKSAAVIAEMRSMLTACEKEDRQLGEGEGKEKEKDQYASLERRSSDITADIQIETRLAERELQLAVVPAPITAVSEDGENRTKTVIPATARYTRSRNFKGEDGAERAYKCGMWYRAIMFRSEQAVSFCKDHGMELRASQAEGTNTAGGYLVPDILEATIIELRETYGVFRPNCRVVPMGSDSVNYPRRTGGLTAYFTNENTSVTTSTKTWDNVQLAAKKVGALVLYPTELAEDAVIALADDLSSEIAYAFAKLEDQCGFIGDGTSTYGGMRGAAVKVNDGNHAGGIFTAASGRTAFSSLTLADFHGAVGILPQYARTGAKWYFSAAGWATSAERLMYAGGGNTVSTIGGGDGPSFLGYPVVISQVLNATLAADVSAIKCLFGNLALAAMMGDRRGIMIKTSAERYFDSDQIGIIGTERFDINVHDLGDGTTGGPIVALKTPAS